MVHQSFSTSSSIKHGRRLIKVLISISIIAFFTFISLLFINRTAIFIDNDNDKDGPSSLPSSDDEDESLAGSSDITTDEEEPPLPIDFQSVVDGFVNSTSGNKSILIYDLDRQEIAGSFEPTKKYSTASLYKLFVVYEGYRRVDKGEWDANTPVGSTGYTILECLDLAIRESHSPCAESLWSMIGHPELDRIVSELGINNTDVSHLTSTPEDILSIMKLFYSHPDISSSELIARMKDSFLNQPITTYNWRQGIPSGFKKANVYNKVGWDYNPDSKNWNIYHDAAIIEFPEQNRHFIVIVMTNYVPLKKIVELGSNIEQLFYTNP